MKRMDRHRYKGEFVNKSLSENKVDSDIRERALRKKEIRYSLLAVLISFIGMFYTFYQDYESNKEEIKIHSFNPLLDSRVSFGERHLPNRLVTLEFGILISNTSDKTISIIDYQLEQVAEDHPIGYSGMNQGLSEKNGKEASMPFILQSGESKLVYIKNGFIVPQNAFIKIDEAFKSKNGNSILPSQELTYEELLYYTAIAETDIYGSEIEGEIYTDEKGNSTVFSVSSLNNNHPIFEITFKTSSGNYFKHQYYENQINNF